MFIKFITVYEICYLFIEFFLDTRRIIDSPERKKKSRRILDDTTEGSDEEKEPSPNKKYRCFITK